MITALLVVLLVLSVALVGWLSVYRVRHPHTTEDLQRARKESVEKSRSVVGGKVQEHLAPLLPEFCDQFNPWDARFIGAPVDLVVFDGLSGKEPLRRIVFVEVKTGRANLSAPERRIRNAIRDGLVEWQEIRLAG